MPLSRMPLSARAGIDLAGNRFRYAVVHTGRSGNRLLRLGECVFDFDAVRMLVSEGKTADREVFLDGLREALGTDPPQALRFVVHPPVATTFLSLSDGEDIESAVHRDAHLLGLLDDEGMTVRIDHLDHRRGMELVTLLPRELGEALGNVCADLGSAAFEVMPGLLASGEVIRSGATDDNPVIGVGLYGDGIEVVAFESRLWRIGTSAGTAGGTRAEILERALETGVMVPDERLARYRFGSGHPDGDFAGLEDIDPFDAFSAVQFDDTGVDPEIDPSQFTAAIGAAIL